MRVMVWAKSLSSVDQSKEFTEINAFCYILFFINMLQVLNSNAYFTVPPHRVSIIHYATIRKQANRKLPAVRDCIYYHL